MNSDMLMELYRHMLVLRHVDEMCFDLKMKDLIMNGFHPYAGQEAVAVGVCSNLRDQDVVVSNHRPQGHCLARGTHPRKIFCEMLGRRGGVSEGIGGPMQWIDAEQRFYCGSIVGSGVSLAGGMALQLQREGRGDVCCCFFGDGASSTGSCHEGMNLASIWKLPVLYLLENNQYGEAMPVEEFVSCTPISKRAAGYSIPGVTVDGMDVVTVHEAVGVALEHIRGGRGPYLIEAVTYRFRGHYGGDPEHTYRTKEEVEHWRQRDPLKLARESLLKGGIPTGELDAMEQEIVSRLQGDQQWALDQPFPTVEQATDHVMLPL